MHLQVQAVDEIARGRSLHNTYVHVHHRTKGSGVFIFFIISPIMQGLRINTRKQHVMD